MIGSKSSAPPDQAQAREDALRWALDELDRQSAELLKFLYPLLAKNFPAASAYKQASMFTTDADTKKYIAARALLTSPVPAQEDGVWAEVAELADWLAVYGNERGNARTSILIIKALRTGNPAAIRAALRLTKLKEGQ